MLCFEFFLHLPLQVDVEIAKASNTIKTMIEDLGIDEDDEEPVPLPNVNGAIMRKVCVLYYMKITVDV